MSVGPTGVGAWVRVDIGCVAGRGGFHSRAFSGRGSSARGDMPACTRLSRAVCVGWMSGAKSDMLSACVPRCAHLRACIGRVSAPAGGLLSCADKKVTKEAAPASSPRRRRAAALHACANCRDQRSALHRHSNPSPTPELVIPAQAGIQSVVVSLAIDRASS